MTTYSMYIALLVMVLVLTLAFVIVRQRWQLGRSGRRLQENREAGRAGEERALEWLQQHGFTVEEQRHVDAWIYVDGTRLPFSMRPDCIATKKGERWIIDVKTGAVAAAHHIQTRRQLREYATYFPDHQVGLFNADTMCLHAIDFPDPAISTRASTPGQRIKKILIITGLTLLFACGVCIGSYLAPQIQWVCAYMK